MVTISMVPTLKLGYTTTAGSFVSAASRNFAEKKLGMPINVPYSSSRNPGRSFLCTTSTTHSAKAVAKV